MRQQSPCCPRSPRFGKSAHLKEEEDPMKGANVLAAAVLIGGVAGCASTEMMPAASPAHELHTFVPGWERFFTIDSQAGQREGRPIPDGGVPNQHGAPASRPPVLVE